jgi:hypothetical protein
VLVVAAAARISLVELQQQALAAQAAAATVDGIT